MAASRAPQECETSPHTASYTYSIYDTRALDRVNKQLREQCAGILFAGTQPPSTEGSQVVCARSTRESALAAGISHVASVRSAGNVFRDPIVGEPHVEYPDSHPMSYFEQLKEAWGKILAVERYSYASTSRVNQGARYGDTIVLDQFADQANLNGDPEILLEIAQNIAHMMLANKVATNRGGGTLVCGSPNEVAPDPTLDDYFDVIHRDLDCIGCQDSYGDYAKQKVTVWTMDALEGEDQVRKNCLVALPIICVLVLLKPPPTF